MLAVLAVVCSTWSPVNVATSQRDPLVPWGATYFPSVRAANKMTSRINIFPIYGHGNGNKVFHDLMGFDLFIWYPIHAYIPGRSTLLMLLLACMDSVFLLENPGGSSILQHPRLVWLFQKLRGLRMPVLRQQVLIPDPGLVFQTGDGFKHVLYVYSHRFTDLLLKYGILRVMSTSIFQCLHECLHPQSSNVQKLDILFCKWF